MTAVCYDEETYPNLFSLAATPYKLHDDRVWVYECSERACSADHLAYAMRSGAFTRMYGFNNLGFDYPILHQFMVCYDAGYRGAAMADMMFKKAQEIISADNPWDNRVRPWDVRVEQIDLYLIHHFDNVMKRTSLKAIEFNIEWWNLEELPFPVGTWLTPQQIPVVLDYNVNDTMATKAFAHKSADAIAFREALIERGWFGREVLNFNDTKIGKQYFIKRLEERAPGVTKREPVKRDRIYLNDCIFPYIQFQRPELRDMMERLRGISFAGWDTKGAYKEIMTLDGFTFDIGQGGIHGSVNNRVITAAGGYVVADIDVRGYYPAMAIENWIFPEHIGPVFSEVYREIRDTRDIAKAAKLMIEAGTLKLSNNGVFGDFGNPHSVLRDPRCMMQVTINGQLLQVMLVEQLLKVPTLEVIQMNTDGVTVRLRREWCESLDAMCNWWCGVTKLDLEKKEYDFFAVRDVNNYLAVEARESQPVRGGWEKHKGGRKRKGAYDWEMLSGSTGGQLAWNRDFSGRVIAKAAEAAFIDDIDPRGFIENHATPYDFLMRYKTVGAHRLELGDGTRLPKTIRYYVSEHGVPLVKIMPPLKGQSADRRQGIHAEGQAECQGDRKSGYRCSRCGAPFATKGMFEAHNKQAHAWGVTIANIWRGDLSGISTHFYVEEAEKLLF